MAASGCANEAIPRLPVADLRAVTEAKPVPGDEIVTDETGRAAALYNSKVEGWGDRIHAAGVRLCRYARATGAKVDCE